MTIDHHFEGVANEQRDDKNQSNQNQFDTPTSAASSGRHVRVWSHYKMISELFNLVRSGPVT